MQEGWNPLPSGRGAVNDWLNRHGTAPQPVGAKPKTHATVRLSADEMTALVDALADVPSMAMVRGRLQMALDTLKD